MTPRRLDRDVVLSRVERIELLLRDLEPILPLDPEAIAEDPYPRYIAERILIAVIDLAAAVNAHIAAGTLGLGPLTYRDSFLKLADAEVLDASLAELLARAAGLRNILVHQYVDVRLTELAEAANRAPDDFRAYTQQILRWARPD